MASFDDDKPQRSKDSQEWRGLKPITNEEFQKFRLNLPPLKDSHKVRQS